MKPLLLNKTSRIVSISLVAVALLCGMYYAVVSPMRLVWEADRSNIPVTLTPVERLVLDSVAGCIAHEREVAEAALEITGKKLEFAERNDLSNGKANCVGYARYFATVCNYLFEAKGFEDCAARPVVGYVYWGRFNLCEVARDLAPKAYENFVKDHDFVIVTYAEEVEHIDPTFHDLWRDGTGWKIIFGILCGLLYWVGALLGLDYYEVSIVMCCYVWPVICTLSTLPILYHLLKRVRVDGREAKWVAGLVASILYTLFYAFCTGYFIFSYHLSSVPGETAATFNKCVHDLTDLAQWLGVTYAVMNLIIYVLGFVFILAFNYMLAQWVKPRRKLGRLIAGGTIALVAGAASVLLVCFS